MPDHEAARLTDPHTCPSVEPGPVPHVGGPIQSGSDTVLIEDLKAARGAVDYAECAAGGPDFIAQGSGTVLINDKVAARMGSKTQHNGVILGKSPTVTIGGPTVTVLKILQRSGAKIPLGGRPSDSNQTGSPSTDIGGKGTSGPEVKEPAKEAENGRVVSRYRLVSSEPVVEGQIAEFLCQSYDPDQGGTEANPNPEEITWRNWEFSINPDEGAKSIYTYSDVSSVQIEVPHLGAEPVRFAIVSLTVRDKGGHTDTRGRSIVVRPTMPVARIAAVPQLMAKGSVASHLIYACNSLYDDLVGLPYNSAENRGAIVRRVWSLTVGGRNIDLARVGDDHVEVLASYFVGVDKNGEVPILTLEIENRFGRTSKTSLPLTNHSKPVAVIVGNGDAPWHKRNNWRMFGEAAVVLMGDDLQFLSGSHMEGWPDEQFRNVGIDSFEWKIRSSNGNLVASSALSTLNWVAGLNGSYTVDLLVANRFGSSSVTRDLTVEDFWVHLRRYFGKLVQTGGVAAVIGAAFAIVAGQVVLPAAVIAAVWAVAGEVVQQFMDSNGAPELVSMTAGILVGSGGSIATNGFRALTTGKSGDAVRRAIIGYELSGHPEMRARAVAEISRAVREVANPGQMIGEEAANRLANKVVDYHMGSPG